MARIAVVLARYALLDFEAEETLSGRDQERLLERLNEAQPVAYRKREPVSSDFDTYIMAPRFGTRQGERYLSWQVCRDISFRQVRKPDRKAQVVRVDFEDTEDCQIARVVALPRLGVLAVEDGSGDGSIGGWSALKRFASITEQRGNSVFDAQPAGSPQDLERALETWKLDRFDFRARPFNPHPKNPGLILSDLLKADKAGELRGRVAPPEGGHMRAADDGLIKETLGLAKEGYATYGAKGRTPSGAEAVLKRPEFSFDRNQNLERLRGSQNLRVYISVNSEDEKIKKSVDIMIEFFGLTDRDGLR